VLTKKTVLVLGAGASQPFGFPTGVELSKRVWQSLRPGHGEFNNLALSGYSPGEIEGFRDEFFYSGKNSVDAFLEHAPEFIPIGKAAIAIILMGYEQRDLVFKFDMNWLRILYANLNTPFEEFHQNQISFVTFNYDRVVEFFLHESVMRSYRKTSEEAWRAIEGMPVIHLHGRMGYLPGQNPNSRSFTHEFDKNSLLTSAEGIKIIHEKIDPKSDPDFVAAKQLLMQAQQILFIGF